MTPNFLHRHRETEQHEPVPPFRASAWGEPQSWPVRRTDGEPLVFQIRLPLEIELVDIATLAGAARGAPDFVAEGAAELEQVAGPAGVVLAGALRPSDVPEAERPVLATLTVAFSDKVKGPPSAEDFPIANSEHTTKTHQEVVKLSDKATLIVHGSTLQLDGGTEPVVMMVWQYLLETRYGALVMAFSTADEQMMYPRPRKLYTRIVESMFIGEQAPPAS